MVSTHNVGTDGGSFEKGPSPSVKYTTPSMSCAPRIEGAKTNRRSVPPRPTHLVDPPRERIDARYGGVALGDRHVRALAEHHELPRDLLELTFGHAERRVDGHEEPRVVGAAWRPTSPRYFERHGSGSADSAATRYAPATVPRATRREGSAPIHGLLRSARGLEELFYQARGRSPGDKVARGGAVARVLTRVEVVFRLLRLEGSGSARLRAAAPPPLRRRGRRRGPVPRLRSSRDAVTAPSTRMAVCAVAPGSAFPRAKKR